MSHAACKTTDDSEPFLPCNVSFLLQNPHKFLANSLVFFKEMSIDNVAIFVAERKNVVQKTKLILLALLL